MIGRIDLLGRAAFGVLCIGGMAGVALPVLAVAGIVGGIAYALDGDGARALTVWLGAWGAAAFAVVLFLVAAYTAWPLASDWITEWPGYVTGVAVGGGGLGLMAALVFATAMPLYAAVIVPLGVAFGAGFLVAGLLAGVRSPAAQRRERPRVRLGRRR